VAAANPLLGLPSMSADLARIEATLAASVRTSDDQLTEMASHLLAAGGKRLRPVMAVAAARTGRADASDDVVRGGVACELVHIGSLYHDDVMDEAELRRGVPSVNARWGNHRAILAGDFLLARASEIAASLGAEVAGLLGTTIGRLVEGQIGELRTQYDPGRTVADYLDSIGGKTASLFGTSARIGAIVAGLDRSHVDALTEFGLAYGTVFQIVDDVLDLTATEEQLGKPAGHDLVEGVYTLPVILTISAGGAGADELVDLLGEPLEGAALDKALSIVRSGDAVAGALEEAARWVARAAAALEVLGPSDAARALAGAAQHLLDSVRPVDQRAKAR
jgi:heptaprenyl diphosphate synthase